MSTTTFDSTKTHLTEILKQIASGKIQLPDFQRGWVWDDVHIRSLLASVSQSYPIGAIMMMHTGNDDVRFKTRPVSGVVLQSPIEPEQLILDGQQRLTSLYMAILAKQPVETKDNRKVLVKRWYYIDIKKALDPNVDREEAILSIPEEKIRRNLWGQIVEDYSTPEKEYENCIFPLNMSNAASKWRREFSKWYNHDQEKMELYDRFEEEILNRFQMYEIPVIALGKDTPKEAVCQVFEKVNTGGVSLSVFELLTATFAADNFQLRDDWLERFAKLNSQRALRSIENTDFLQVISLLSTFERKEVAVGCKRKDILNLKLDEYKKWAEAATQGFLRVAKFLHTQKIFDYRDLPYRTQLVPLAATYAWLGNKADTDGANSKIARWYWCGVLGELYGSAIETRFAKDFPELVNWISGGEEPTTIMDSNFTASRLLTLRTRNSAAYKGIAALLLREGGQDFRTGYLIDHQIYFDDKIDIHHIFPKDYCQSQKIDMKRCDCIVNKTPLSARTNRMIGGKAPSEYLVKLQKEADILPDRMNEILFSHVINPDLLRKNLFGLFFDQRMNTLLGIIEGAMGKSAARDLETDALLDVEVDDVCDTDD